MIGRANEKTKKDKTGPTAVLHFLLRLVGMILITTSQLLFESICLGCLRFAFGNDAKGINCAGNAFIGGNAFTSGNVFAGVSFFL